MGTAFVSTASASCAVVTCIWLHRHIGSVQRMYFTKNGRTGTNVAKLVVYCLREDNLPM